MHQAKRRAVICGAAGRDFHNFNTVYRDRDDTQVVAFTATQIPGIDERCYPTELAGPLYPDGIPIVGEETLKELCLREAIDEVVFAYSDISHTHVMDVATVALAAGADFSLLGTNSTMLQAKVPVISVCAVRTGCGKSQIARYLCGYLGEKKVRAAALRHPMPYGHLAAQAVQRFATMEEMDQADCTLEEREEYEPYVDMGAVIYAGADYQAILNEAEKEADVIVWDGGNNDLSFIRPDLAIAVVDALRPDQLDTHYPGSVVLQTADLVIINKVLAANDDQKTEILKGLDRLVPDVPRVMAASPVRLDDPARLEGKRVLIVEDGPTITHGGMPHGAGFHAVNQLQNIELVDPRTSAVPEIAAVFEAHPHIGPVLPAMGYSKGQRQALTDTILASNAEVVVAGTPIDIARVLELDIPVVRARYQYEDADANGLSVHIDDFLSTFIDD